MSLYVLVGPDGKVYERTAKATKAECWDSSGHASYPIRSLPCFDGYVTDQRAARRLGWRVRKCHIVLEDE